MKNFEDNLITYLAVKLPSDIPSSTIQEIAAYCTAKTVIAINDAINHRDEQWREADKERLSRRQRELLRKFKGEKDIDGQSINYSTEGASQS